MSSCGTCTYHGKYAEKDAHLRPWPCTECDGGNHFQERGTRKKSIPLRVQLDALRAENERLGEENSALKKRVYEGTLYHHDICKIATILGIRYHMTQRVTTFVDTVREWSNSYDCVLTRVQEAEKQNAAQAEQIKRLREALAQIQRNASANRVWSGEKWTYLGLTYVAQTKIVRLADEALKEASND